MRLSKFTILFVGAILGILLMTLTGCDGISGDRGPTGDTGLPGDDYQAPAPENRFFALAVTNNSLRSHNGAPKLYLAFDEVHQAAGDTVVSQRLASGSIPSIDGVDGGDAEWGALKTNVNLLRAAGDYNFIPTAQVRSAFDNEYVYFQVKWSEVENAEFGLTVERSSIAEHWIYPSTGTGNNVRRWTKSASSFNEDRVSFFFPITTVTRFTSDGCLVTCHTLDPQNGVPGNYHATRSGGERMDIWHWTSAVANPTGYAFDRYMINGFTNGVKDDIGTPLARANRETAFAGADTTDRPIYMAVTDPNGNSDYPLWDYETTRISETGWVPGSTIPSYVVSIPMGSTADLETVGQFDAETGTWTVEIKRKRFTGNGDDVRF